MNYQVCSENGSCKTTDKVYGVVQGTKLRRLTFAKDLAQHICTHLEGHEVKRFKFFVGRQLEPGEESKSGMYAICSNLPKTKGLVLRISLIKEAAELMTGDEYRYLAECWLV